MMNSGTLSILLVNYTAALSNDIKGESKICRTTSLGFYFKVNRSVQVAPMDLPQSINCL